MLSNNTLSAVVDTLSHLDEARKAKSKKEKGFYLSLAEMSLGRALRGIPLDHPQREALVAKERQIILARAALS